VDQRDLEYWLQSNTPVILVIVRLSDQLIVWKSLQNWFSTPERRATRRIDFDKTTDSLTPNSIPGFVEVIASFAKPGLMVPPMRAAEALDTNLLRAIFPVRLNIAPIDMDHRQLRSRLLETDDHPPIDWVVYGKRIVTFRDLELPPFNGHIEQAPESIGTAEWANSDGPATRRQFTDLLRRCLSSRVHHRLIYYGPRTYFFFRRGRHSIERKLDYRSYEKSAKRYVVKGYGKAKSGNGFAYYRHAAFVPRFLEIRAHWYLAIDPTYHFTRDGYEDYAFAAERLAGIKRLETNQSVRGHIGMWRAVLTEGSDLLRSQYQFLRFESVDPLPFPFGVPDDLWRGTEDEERRRDFEEAQSDLFS
jgi:Domain of unknown function (DUF4365)